MPRRSLQASCEGIKKATAALIGRSLTQAGLAAELGISRQPVNKFFQGKAVERYIFVEICEKLGLVWDEIATFSSLPDVDDTGIAQIDSLVQTVRAQVYESIQRCCGIMRVLDMQQPMGLNAIYINVNMFEQVTGSRRLSITQLQESIYQKRVSAIDALLRYNKLMIWGKPGAGKTTFLKWVVIQCIQGNYRADCVPMLISLKDFAQDKEQCLLDYITAQFRECGVVESQAVQTLLSQGRVIVLLDGLDEVTPADMDRVLQEIRFFSTRFYSNSLAIACRIGACEYTFEQFTEVEIADFDEQQIANFAIKWFHNQDTTSSEHFQLQLQANQQIQELATNPLLLTLLCQIFEQMADFPAPESFYKEVLDILLKKWDAQRNIKRHQVYQPLSLQRKQDLLSQIARTTFERGEFFFKQTAVEQHIQEYICRLPDTNSEEVLQVDSEAILKSIEAQHGLLVERAKGIYSFSHLIFQQYFASL